MLSLHPIGQVQPLAPSLAWVCRIGCAIFRPMQELPRGSKADHRWVPKSPVGNSGMATAAGQREGFTVAWGDEIGIGALVVVLILL